MARFAQTELDSHLATVLSGVPEVLESLLDALEDVVFFAKDLAGRYRLVNQTLVQRAGRSSKSQLIGLRADEIFPAPFGEAYLSQDLQVIRSGRAIRDRLELHFYSGRRTGWCRTVKTPLLHDSKIVGLMGFSKDIHRPASDQTPGGVALAMEHLQENLARQVSVSELAKVAGMATRSFERAVASLFRASVGDLMIQARIELACRLLSQTESPVGYIAQECGYAEHSSFSRQFRARVGLTPRQFRQVQEGQSDS